MVEKGRRDVKITNGFTSTQSGEDNEVRTIFFLYKTHIKFLLPRNNMFTHNDSVYMGWDLRCLIHCNTRLSSSLVSHNNGFKLEH